MIEINLDPTRREIRVFGLLWLIFFGAIGGLALWKPQGLIGAAAVLGTAWLCSLVFNPHDRVRQLLGICLPLVLGLSGGAALSGIGAWNVARVAWVLAGTGGLLIAAVPALGRRVYVTWMLATVPIGWSITHVLLGIVYYLVLTPIGLLLRVFGYDAMSRRLDPAAASYWSERRTDRGASSYFHQF